MPIYFAMTDIDDSVKKMKNKEQNFKSNAEITEDHAEEKPSLEH